MKRIFNIFTIATALFATSCIKDDYVKEANYDFKTNYEAFWNLVNENYCYLGDNYGYTKNVDWYKVYEEMMPQVEKATTEEELLEIMGKSIDYLKDGHVWLDTKFKHRGCFTFYYDENGDVYSSHDCDAEGNIISKEESSTDIGGSEKDEFVSGDAAN
jgi:hypothetical protein